MGFADISPTDFQNDKRELQNIKNKISQTTIKKTAGGEMKKFKIGDKVKVKTSKAFKSRRITHLDPFRYQVRVEHMKTKKGVWVNYENIYPYDYEETKK